MKIRVNTNDLLDLRPLAASEAGRYALNCVFIHGSVMIATDGKALGGVGARHEPADSDDPVKWAETTEAIKDPQFRCMIPNALLDLVKKQLKKSKGSYSPASLVFELELHSDSPKTFLAISVSGTGLATLTTSREELDRAGQYPDWVSCMPTAWHRMTIGFDPKYLAVVAEFMRRDGLGKCIMQAVGPTTGVSFRSTSGQSFALAMPYEIGRGETDACFMDRVADLSPKIRDYAIKDCAGQEVCSIEIDRVLLEDYLRVVPHATLAEARARMLEIEGAYHERLIEAKHEALRDLIPCGPDGISTCGPTDGAVVSEAMADAL